MESLEEWIEFGSWTNHKVIEIYEPKVEVKKDEQKTEKVLPPKKPKPRMKLSIQD
jgi:hypothetical protein